VDPELLRRRIEVNLSLLDSVVFTGGEPILQQEAVMEAAEIVKGFGLKLMLDTNGSLPETMEKMLDDGLVDRVALDVKAPVTAEDYGRVIGIIRLGAEMAEAVEHTLELCNSHGVEVEVRTTVAPTVSDNPNFIRRIAPSIRGRCSVYHLQQFDNTGDILSPHLKELKPPSRETMVKLAEVALAEGVNEVYIKTRAFGLERMG